MDRLSKLQNEYVCLLELLPHGGAEATELYKSSSIPWDQTDAEVERLEKEIPELKEKLSDFGIVWKDWLNSEKE